MYRILTALLGLSTMVRLDPMLNFENRFTRSNINVNLVISGDILSLAIIRMAELVSISKYTKFKFVYSVHISQTPHNTQNAIFFQFSKNINISLAEFKTKVFDVIRVVYLDRCILRKNDRFADLCFSSKKSDKFFRIKQNTTSILSALQNCCGISSRDVLNSLLNIRSYKKTHVALKWMPSYEIHPVIRSIATPACTIVVQYVNRYKCVVFNIDFDITVANECDNQRYIQILNYSISDNCKLKSNSFENFVTPNFTPNPVYSGCTVLDGIKLSVMGDGMGCRDNFGVCIFSECVIPLPDIHGLIPMRKTLRFTVDSFIEPPDTSTFVWHLKNIFSVNNVLYENSKFSGYKHYPVIVKNVNISKSHTHFTIIRSADLHVYYKLFQSNMSMCSIKGVGLLLFKSTCLYKDMRISLIVCKNYFGLESLEAVNLKWIFCTIS